MDDSIKTDRVLYCDPETGETLIPPPPAVPFFSELELSLSSLRVAA